MKNAKLSPFTFRPCLVKDEEHCSSRCTWFGSEERYAPIGCYATGEWIVLEHCNCTECDPLLFCIRTDECKANPKAITKEEYFGSDEYKEAFFGDDLTSFEKAE